MRPRISIAGSVRPSVRPSVTLSLKTREINIFEKNIVRGGILGPLDVSLHLYKPVYWYIGQPVSTLVSQSIDLCVPLL